MKSTEKSSTQTHTHTQTPTKALKASGNYSFHTDQEVIEGQGGGGGEVGGKNWEVGVLSMTKTT